MMQLFLINTPDNKDRFEINDKTLMHQMCRVLRMQVGSECAFQRTEGCETIRGLYEMISMSKSIGIFQKKQELEIKVMNQKQVIVAIALPNKRSKAELITQKLTEIGVYKLIWFGSERSQNTDIPDKKMQRMIEISKEATEQSWGRYEMAIQYEDSFERLWDNTDQRIVCDIPEDGLTGSGSQENMLLGVSPTLFVGPEGGRGPKDYKIFQKYPYTIMNLGTRTLRMETAAIIAGWKGINEIKNLTI